MRNETFDQFLRGQGVEEKSLTAFRRVVAWQLAEGMATAGVNEHELARRIKTRPELIGPFLDAPETAPLLITTLREAFAAVGRPVMTLLDSLQ